MSSKSLFDNPTVPRLLTVLEEVRSGNLLIPDFQRPFEWNDDRRLLLLDSIAKGMPIGSFLVWRTRKNKLSSQPRLGPFALPLEPPEGETRSYLLDGNQRMTTLYTALTEVQDPEALDEQGVRWPVYYDLSIPRNEQGFTLHKGRSAPPRTWLPLSVLLVPKKLYDFQKRLMDQGFDQEADRAEALANSFKDYQIPIVPLVSEDIDVVTESFVRINNQGKPMQETHMVRALSYSKFDIREELDRLRQELAPVGWGALDDQVLVNALKARWNLDIYKAGPRELHDHLLKAGHAETFRELGENIKQAVNFLSTCGVGGPRALPYSYQLVAIVEVIRKINPALDGELGNLLRKWFWATTYAGYFTGMTSNRIREAIDHLCDVASGYTEWLPRDLPRQIQRLRHFNFNATRSKAFALLLVISIPEKALRTKAQLLLGVAGSSAVEKLFPDVAGDDPANRVVTTPDELSRLRRVLARPGHYAPHQLKVLARYKVPNGPPPLFANYDEHMILAQRQSELEQLESKFIQDIGLTLEF